jgi:hypothetical protein
VFAIHLLCGGKQLGFEFSQRAIGIEAGIFRHFDLGLDGGRFVRLLWFLRRFCVLRSGGLFRHGPHMCRRTRARRVEWPGQFFQRLRQQF